MIRWAKPAFIVLNLILTHSLSYSAWQKIEAHIHTVEGLLSRLKRDLRATVSEIILYFHLSIGIPLSHSTRHLMPSPSLFQSIMTNSNLLFSIKFTNIHWFYLYAATNLHTNTIQVQNEDLSLFHNFHQNYSKIRQRCQGADAARAIAACEENFRHAKRPTQSVAQFMTNQAG